MASVEIEYEGEKKLVEISENETVLEAGLREGMDLPYSCMSGICTACKAETLEGDIVMEDAEALDEDEIRAGYILTCCAYVKSETAKVNYDEEE